MVEWQKESESEPKQPEQDRQPKPRQPEQEIDDLVLEIQKSGFDDQFTILAADTIKVTQRMREIKKNLDTGVYKSKDIEELYRIELMRLDLRTSQNILEMNKLLGANPNVLKVIKVRTDY